MTSIMPPPPAQLERCAELSKAENALSMWEWIIRLIAFPFICLSSWLTTKGLFDAKIEAHAANTEGMITAAMTALVAAIMIGGANFLLFGLASHAGKRQRKQVIALTVAILPFVAAISTYNAILATSAEKSVILSLRQRSVAWTEYAESSAKDADNAQAAQADLSRLRASLCALADGEENRGVLTGGAKGKGSVYAAYFASCGAVTDIVGTLDETAKRNAGRRDAANAIIAKMEKIPRDTSVTVFERMERFKTQDRLLRKLIAESAAERVADRLEAQLTSLQDSVATLGVKDGAFGRTQEQAVANLKASLSGVSGAIEKLTAKKEELPTSPEAMPSLEKSIAMHWKASIPTIAIAVATDTFSLWLISFLFVARSMVQERRDALRHPHISKN